MASNEQTSTIQGLTETEAAARLAADGYNELPSQKQKSILHLLGEVLHEPMLLLLLGSGLIYFILGEHQDAVMLLLFVVVVVGITLYQERKTERALDALRTMSSPRALVIRDGEQRRIAGRDVVVGDVIILREGDRVPADAVVVDCAHLLIDESLLTGESMPVRKSAGQGSEHVGRPGGEDTPFVYSGTLVVQGRGVARVMVTGARTEIGKIGKALETIQEEETLLQKETGALVRTFSIIGLGLCALVTVVYAMTQGTWLKGILSGLTLSMAMIPEEFPVVLIIFLTMGAWRISRNHVLTRRAQAIETLGAATVLCTDKTGTLTANTMRLTTLAAGNALYDIDGTNGTALPEAVHSLIEYGILASQRDPFDPIEKEVKRIGQRFLQETEHIHENWSLKKEYPLSKDLLALSHVWESPDRKKYVIATKGSPEAIIDLCHCNAEGKTQIMHMFETMAERGLRVLGVAKAVFSKTYLPEEQHAFDFAFVGLLGFIDPVRDGVPDAIEEAHAAGMRVIMITGDYPRTAQHIAARVGIKNPHECITGAELAAMSPEQLHDKIARTNVFARIVPEQKMAIVNALKGRGEIVAMTGDGVNDAPALKSAHIGIAMGERGTDVARESAALVLLDDDFSSIVHAVRLGRRIYDNLKKAICFIFAVHIPIAGMSLLPVLLKMPMMLLPAHIAFLELIIDPACSTVFEAYPEERTVMHRPPRRLGEPLFTRYAFVLSVLQGVSMWGVVFAVYAGTLAWHGGEAEARTLAFATLVFANILLIVTSLSWSANLVEIIQKRNVALWTVVVGALVAFVTIVYVPFLQDLFHFAPLSLQEIAIGLCCGCVSLIWFEILKTGTQKIRKKRHAC